MIFAFLRGGHRHFPTWNRPEEFVPSWSLITYTKSDKRSTMIFNQALIDTGTDDVECEVTTVAYKELKYQHLEPFFEVATPIGLSGGYWEESVALAALAIVSAECALVIEFPQPSRRGQVEATSLYDPDSEQYQSLMSFLSRNAGEFFAFDLAPLAMVLYQEQGLFLKNAVDVQSAFPRRKRNSISDILKAALGDETKIYELLLAEAFNDVTYNPEYRTAALGPVKRAWLAYYLGSVGDAVTTYSSVKRINTFDMNDGVCFVVFSVVESSWAIFFLASRCYCKDYYRFSASRSQKARSNQSRFRISWLRLEE